MHFYVLADISSGLATEEIRAVNNALMRLAEIFNLLSDELRDQTGSGDAEVILLPFGGLVDLDGIANAQKCGAIVFDKVRRQRIRGYCLIDAMRAATEMHHSGINGNDRDFRLVIILGSVPPRDFDEHLDQVLADLPDPQFTHLVVSCHPAIATDARFTGRFQVILDDDIAEDSIEAWALDGGSSKSASQTGTVPASASPTIAPAQPITVSIPSLRAAVNPANANAILNLGACEYIGDCVISKSLSLTGESEQRPAHIIGVNGPTLKITSGEVSLLNVTIEAGANGVALERTPGVKLAVSNVTVRGKVLGIQGEDGPWDIPSSVDFCDVPADTAARQSLVIEVPVSCTVSSTIAGINPITTILEPGVRKIDMTVEPGRAGNVIFGYITLQTSFFLRKIQVTGRYVTGIHALSDLAWTCARFQADPGALNSMPRPIAASLPVPVQNTPSSAATAPILTPPTLPAPITGIGVQQQRKTTSSIPIGALFRPKVDGIPSGTEPLSAATAAVVEASIVDQVKEPASTQAVIKSTKSLPNPALFGIKPKHP